MQRARWILFLAVVMIAAGFLVVHTFRKTRPDIPVDAEHLAARGQADVCMACHGPEGASPRSPNHPLGRGACETCHYWVGEAR